MAMTWTSTACSIIGALALLDDAGLARRAVRDREQGKPLKIDGRSQSRGRSRGLSFHDDVNGASSWEHLPQSALEDKELAWGIKSPRKRVTASSTWGFSEQDVERGSIRSIDLDDRAKLG